MSKTEHTPEYIPMRYTINCVVEGCGKEATHYSGHVITRLGEHILAGCCKAHSDKGLHPIGAPYADYMGMHWHEGYVFDLQKLNTEMLEALKEASKKLKEGSLSADTETSILMYSIADSFEDLIAKAEGAN